MPSYYTINGQDFATYSAASGVVPVSDYQVNTFAGVNVKIDPSATGVPASVSDVTIGTLNLATGNTGASISILQNGGTITLSSGGLIKSGSGSAVLGGNIIVTGAPGALTSTTGELDVFVDGGGLPPGTPGLTYAGQIVGDMDLLKSGSGTLVIGAGAADTYSNTFTGTLYVNGGTVILNKADGTNAVPGAVQVNGGTLTLARPNQIGQSSTLILSSGALQLANQQQTVANFTNNGGAFSTGTGLFIVTETGGLGGISTGGDLGNVTAAGIVTFNSGSNSIDPGGTVVCSTLNLNGGSNTVSGLLVVNATINVASARRSR